MSRRQSSARGASAPMPSARAKTLPLAPLKPLPAAPPRPALPIGFLRKSEDNCRRCGSFRIEELQAEYEHGGRLWALIRCGCTPPEGRPSE